MNPPSPSAVTDSKVSAAPLPGRTDFPHFLAIPTRWMDNDVYGHVNNVVHYSLFDTAVNGYLIEAGALDIHRSPVIGLVVETQCNYFAPLEFPQMVEAGLRVARSAPATRPGRVSSSPVGRRGRGTGGIIRNS